MVITVVIGHIAGGELNYAHAHEEQSENYKGIKIRENAFLHWQSVQVKDWLVWIREHFQTSLVFLIIKDGQLSVSVATASNKHINKNN